MVTLALVSAPSTVLQTVLMQGPVACTQAPVQLFGTLATVATTRMQYLIQLLMEPRTRNAVIVRGAGERVRVEATQGVEGLAILVIIALRRPIRIQSLRMTPHNFSTVLRIKSAARVLQTTKKPFPGTTSFVRLNVQTITIAPMRMRNNEPMLSAPRMQRAVRARRRLMTLLKETIFFAEERAGVRGVVATLALIQKQY